MDIKEKELALNTIASLPSKIEVAKNTKGFNYTVEVRCKDGFELEAVDRLETIVKSLNEKFKSAE